MSRHNHYSEPIELVLEKSGYDAEYRGEVKRVIHAYWIERKREFDSRIDPWDGYITQYTIMCSNCGNEIAGGNSSFKYCLECGAKMDLKPRGAIAKYKLMTGWMK
jgi:hypothetical protein